MRRVAWCLVALTGACDEVSPSGDAASVPARVEAGPVPVGLPTLFEIEVRAGAEPLDVRTVHLSGDEALLTVGEAWVRDVRFDGLQDLRDGAHVVPAGATFAWPFVVVASAAGIVEGVATFTTSEGPLVADVIVDVPQPALIAGPAVLDFGVVAPDDVVVRALAVENPTDVAVVVLPSFEPDDVFGSQEPRPRVIHPRERTSYELVARPSAAGTARATLTLLAGEDPVASAELVVNAGEE